MPANHGPSVLVTGIHSPIGEYLGSEFMGHGWFVIGTDGSGRTSHFARAHVRADLANTDSYANAVRRAARLGNGIDCVINVDEVPVFGAEGASFVRAAFEHGLAETSGCIVNVLAGAGSEGLEREFVQRRTAELAGLAPHARVSTVAPYVVESAPAYRGSDADEFLATLDAHEFSSRSRPTLDDVASAAFFACTEPLRGVTLGAGDILPLLRR